MTQSELVLTRRRETVGLIAVAAWAVGFFGTFVHGFEIFAPWAFLTAWTMGAAWVAIDATAHSRRRTPWTLFTLVTGPVGLVIYSLTRPPSAALCTSCGAVKSGSYQPCPTCGHQPLPGRLMESFRQVHSALVGSLASSPVDTAKHTAKHMAIALAAVAVFGALLSSLRLNIGWLFGLLSVISAAAYWVLVAWWIYLDASWRKMEAVPWAMLALVTNLFGLVTYLVVRYPDPRTCPQCSASLASGLKRCPYCGAEAEPTCPRCQAQVKPDWVYCPACAARLPEASPTPAVSAPLMAVRGTVVDAHTGSPVARAHVRIDSRAGAGSTVTDELGRFALADLSPRPYVLIASADGYAEEAKPCVSISDGQVQVHFSLHPQSLVDGRR